MKAMNSNITLQFSPEFENHQQLALFCGQNNENLHFIEKKLAIIIKHRGELFIVEGDENSAVQALRVLQELYTMVKKQRSVTLEELHLMTHTVQHADLSSSAAMSTKVLHTKCGMIKPRSKNQQIYVDRILSHDINFGVGPAGTGKTYLAVACAVDALIKDQVNRIILVRPAIEAGERLGFLPGDLTEKINPYLRPLYDALYEMLTFEYVEKLLSKNIIEIAPLAYMRGRTLNDAFIILDESQNTTEEQMKMFLTRIGFKSKVVITGDVTQIDLVQGKRSGLLHVIDILKEVAGISFTFFNSKDVVRHPLVQKIIEAYEARIED